jgi:hypothetical protein
MTEKELSVKLRESARKFGLCDQWYNNWNDDIGKEGLIEMYLRGLDFCIKHRWPTKTFIKQNFTQDFLRRHGILVDDTRSYPVRDENRRQMYLKEYVLLGNSHATIRYSFRPHMCQVWVCDNANVTVDVKYGAYILIHLFDKSSADVKTDLVSNVCVIRHTPDVKVKKEGIVTVKDEFHYLD